MDATLLPSQMTARNSSPDVNSIAETGFIDWDAVDSNHSSEQDQTIKAGRVIQAQAERESQAAHLEDLPLETEKKRVEVKP